MRSNRHIRKAEEHELPRIMQLIECGRQKMRAMGNIEQWADGYPKEEVIMQDIENGNSYLVIENGVAIATFAFVEGPDITYREIYEGRWIDSVAPYHVIHRAASVPSVHGIMRTILDWCSCRTNNICVDTHRQNTIMRQALKSNGFLYCGIIYLLDGAERLAYQRVLCHNK